MNRKLVFKRAWADHKIKLKHNCESRFGDSVKSYFRVARMLGEDFKEQPNEFTSRSNFINEWTPKQDYEGIVPCEW
jgi:hypothetical protein